MNDDSSARIVAGLEDWLTTAAPGARLPSSRALVARYGASPVTVQKALRTLGARGVVETRPGVGTFARAVRVARPHDYGWQTAALGSPPSRPPRLSTALRTVPNDAIALHEVEGYEIGAVGDSTDPADFDTSTFAGSFEATVQAMRAKWPRRPPQARSRRQPTSAPPQPGKCVRR
jgi:DNA-binding transcriptional MocR family regulator